LCNLVRLMLSRAACRGTPRYQAKSMALYRCYFLDARNHVISFVIINTATDTLACTEADKLWKASPHHGVELWNGAAMIHHEIARAV